MSDKQEFPLEIQELMTRDEEPQEEEPTEEPEPEEAPEAEDPEPDEHVERLEDIEDVGELRNRLQEEIRRRDGILGDLQEARERIKRYDQTVSEFRSQLEEKEAARQEQDQGPPDEDTPDPRTDPLGYLEWKREQEMGTLRSELREIKDVFSKSREEEQRQAELQREIQRLQKQEHEFTQENPDFEDAVNYWKERSLDSLVEAGYNRIDAMNAADQALKELFLEAYNANANVPKYLYNEAVRAGWKKKQPRQQHQAAPVHEEEARVREGRPDVSLSQVAGGRSGNSGSSVISLEEYRKMPESERLGIIKDENLFKQLMTRGYVQLPRS